MLLAKIISRTFDIYTLFPISIIIFASHARADTKTVLLWVGIFFLAMVLFPMGGILLLIREHWIGDWDITQRIQRVPFEIIAMIGAFLLFALCMLLHAPRIFQAASFIYYILSLSFLLITEQWKISMHALLITTTVTILLYFYGLPFLPAVLIIPCVYWARIVLGKHTFTQLLVSSIISVLIVVFILSFYQV